MMMRITDRQLMVCWIRMMSRVAYH